jgi:hypothetical protein
MIFKNTKTKIEDELALIILQINQYIIEDLRKIRANTPHAYFEKITFRLCKCIKIV